MENYASYLSNKMHRELQSKLEGFIIEGLKRKGFEFEHPALLYRFIEERCRCEEQQERQERIYYVDDTPFFLHKYATNISPVFEEDNQTKITADLGHYAYL